MEKGSDDKYGARPLRRAVQTYIEDAMAEEVLNGKISSGDSVVVSMKNKEINFSLKEK